MYTMIVYNRYLEKWKNKMHDRAEILMDKRDKWSIT